MRREWPTISKRDFFAAKTRERNGMEGKKEMLATLTKSFLPFRRFPFLRVPNQRSSSLGDPAEKDWIEQKWKSGWKKSFLVVTFFHSFTPREKLAKSRKLSVS